MVSCDIGRAGLLARPAVLGQPLRPRRHLVPHRGAHAHVGTGQGRDRSERREGPRPARVGEHARARRRVRHVPARRGVLRDPRRRVEVARRPPTTSVVSDQANLLPIWVDALTFLVSALLISRLRPRRRRTRGRSSGCPRRRRGHDIVDGLRFVRANPLVRGVMVGLAGGLLGGGMIIPLGALFASDVLGGGRSAFGLLMTSRSALGARDRRGHALGAATALAARGGVHDRGRDHGCGDRRGRRGVVVDARDLSRRAASARARVARTSPASRCCRSASATTCAVVPSRRCTPSCGCACCCRSRSVRSLPSALGFHCERDRPTDRCQVRDRAPEPARARASRCGSAG